MTYTLASPEERSDSYRQSTTRASTLNAQVHQQILSYTLKQKKKLSTRLRYLPHTTNSYTCSPEIVNEGPAEAKWLTEAELAEMVEVGAELLEVGAKLVEQRKQGKVN